MIPILYEKTETSFTTNGLGRLSDAISCVVTEERNGAYELHMEYPVKGIHFSDITISRFIYAEPADGKDPQPFRVYSISKPLDGIVDVEAEHISYQLSHIPVSPFTASSVGDAMSGLKAHAAESCPFAFWTDKTTSADFKVTVPSSIRSILGGVQGSILDTFGGGDYEFDRYDVKLYQNRGSNKGVTLRYGKNITDIRQEENIENTITGVMPYWQGLNDASNEVVVTLSEKVLHSTYASNFPYQRTVPLDLSSEFENKPTEAQLRTTAQNYMDANNIGVPSVSIEVSFIALWQTEEYRNIANLERINLCDTVNVEFEPLGITATAKVVKTEYDVLNGRYKSIEIGDARNSLAKTVRSDIAETSETATKKLPTKTFMQLAIEHATNLLSGGLGGHIVLKLNANGEPEELLAMDTDDIATAVDVVRLNKAGIGFSTSGYAGPYTTAWTIDGKFNADFITAGHLIANIIQGGTLTLGGKDNGNGVLRVLDANGNQVGLWNKDGINAIAGKIGGFTIASTYMRNDSAYTQGTSTADVMGILINAPSNPTGSNYAFGVRKMDYDGSAFSNYRYPFYVNYNGKLHAENAEITGKIETSEGRVGGWEILDRYLYALNNGKYTVLKKDGNVAFAAGSPSYSDTAGAALQIWHNGKLYANNAEIEGSIKSSSKTSSYGETTTLSTEIKNAKIVCTHEYTDSQGETETTTTTLRMSMNFEVESENHMFLYSASETIVSGDFRAWLGYGNKYGSIKYVTVDEDGTEVRGGFAAYGSKSRAVETEYDGDRLLYCYEMPEPIFGDCGPGITDETGVAVIYFDDLFRKTINSKVEYQVFLQKEGPGDLWVSKKHEDYFVVEGTENLKFSWEIKAKQFDSAMTRLERFREFSGKERIVKESIKDAEDTLMKDVEQYIKEQEELLYETA